MGELKKEILKNKNRQKQLKKDVKNIKNKLPKHLLSMALITAILLFTLRNRVYIYFGNIINFVKTGIFILVITCIIYILFSYFKIKKKKKEILSINKKLFKLMKLKSE